MIQKSRTNLMKTLFAVLITISLCAGAIGQQSLGEIARQNRTKKKPSSTIKFSDDNMPRTIAPEAEPAKGAADQDENSGAEAEKASKEKKAESNPAEAEKQEKQEIQKNIDSEKKEIADLQRELDIAQREQKLRAAAYYGDAGTMLRDSAKYTEESKKQQDEIDAKKQALDAAQQKLGDLQEQARKAGMHESE
jgi:hypothetical protein